MAFPNSFRTKQKDVKGRDIFKDRDTGTLFTVQNGKQIVGRPGGSRDGGGGGGGGGGERREEPRQDDSRRVAQEEFARLPSIEDIMRREEEARQQRLKQFVDPVLSQQRDVIEGLKGRSSIEDLFNNLRTERGVPQTEALLRALQQQALDLEGELGDLPESVRERTAGRLVTASQQKRIEQKERDPLLEQLNDLLRNTERERAGFGTTLQGIQDALNIRVQQEGRDIEPSERALQFGGFNLDRARQDEASRLQSILSGITQDRQTDLSRIGSLIGSAQQGEQARQQESLARLQQELQNQSQLEGEIAGGLNAGDRDFLVSSAQDLSQRGVAPNEIVRILQGSKPNVDASQIQALVELATAGFGAGGPGGAQQGGGARLNTAPNAGLSSQLSNLVRGGNVPGLQLLGAGGGGASTGRAPLF